MLRSSTWACSKRPLSCCRRPGLDCDVLHFGPAAVLQSGRPSPAGLSLTPVGAGLSLLPMSGGLLIFAFSARASSVTSARDVRSA
jgi:hypothetical protein